MTRFKWIGGIMTILLVAFGLWFLFVQNAQSQCCRMGGGMMSVMSPMRQWAAGAEFDGSPTQPRPKETPQLIALGKSTYQSFCVTCHGVNGNGNGLEAKQLTVRARDFREGVYKFRSTASGQLPTDMDVFRTISRGVHGTSMMPWVGLPERERWALVVYLKTFSEKFKEAPSPESIEIPSAPELTPEWIQRGAQMYKDAGCADCHGIDGRGVGPSAPTLKDDWGYPIRPRDFREGQFKAGSQPDDIYRTLITGLNGTPMPSYQALSPEDLWALVAYVRSMLPEHSPSQGMGMMGMTGAHPEERLGLMIEMRTMMGMGMGGMRRGMMR